VTFSKAEPNKPAVEPFTVFPPAGSMNLGSDYDVSLGGEHEAVGVARFNELFRAHWSHEAGTVFDTNLYTTGMYLSGAGGKLSDDDSNYAQDVLSLTKVRRYVKDAAEWGKR
jgi:hypothetical protein